MSLGKCLLTSSFSLLLGLGNSLLAAVDTLASRFRDLVCLVDHVSGIAVSRPSQEAGQSSIVSLVEFDCVVLVAHVEAPLKILDQKKNHRLRSLIARALDEGSAENEKYISARAVCRLLAEFGLGVDGDATEDLILLKAEDIAPTLPAMNQVDLEQINTIFNDLFGSPNFGRRKPRRRPY